LGFSHRFHFVDLEPNLSRTAYIGVIEEKRVIALKSFSELFPVPDSQSDSRGGSPSAGFGGAFYDQRAETYRGGLKIEVHLGRLAGRHRDPLAYPAISD